MEVDFKEYRALFERPLVLFDSIFVPYSNAFVEDKTNYLSVSLSNITLLFMPAWILSLYFGELELHSSSQVSWGTADFIWTALERCSLVLLGNFFKFYSMLFNDTCNTQKNQLKKWWKNRKIIWRHSNWSHIMLDQRASCHSFSSNSDVDLLSIHHIPHLYLSPDVDPGAKVKSVPSTTSLAKFDTFRGQDSVWLLNPRSHCLCQILRSQRVKVRVSVS